MLLVKSKVGDFMSLTVVLDKKDWLTDWASLFEVECFVSVCIASNNCNFLQKVDFLKKIITKS